MLILFLIAAGFCFGISIVAGITAFVTLALGCVGFVQIIGHLQHVKEEPFIVFILAELLWIAILGGIFALVYFKLGNCVYGLYVGYVCAFINSLKGGITENN